MEESLRQVAVFLKIYSQQLHSLFVARGPSPGRQRKIEMAALHEKYSFSCNAAVFILPFIPNFCFSTHTYIPHRQHDNFLPSYSPAPVNFSYTKSHGKSHPFRMKSHHPRAERAGPRDVRRHIEPPQLHPRPGIQGQGLVCLMASQVASRLSLTNQNLVNSHTRPLAVVQGAAPAGVLYFRML